ncbi:MAG: hypothetical protein KDJ14_02380 [Xanthomonadales bacterium]|nr:hypothetical protein [Xanthomonadales bacterium]
MKLQFDASGTRIRIDESELATLQSDGAVCTRYRVDANWRGTLAVELVDRITAKRPRWSTTRDDSGWTATLRIERAALAAHVDCLPSRTGLSWTLSQVGAEALTIVFEVDVRDSTRRRGPRSR